MQSFWNSLDPIVLPIAICDAKGVIVYKNEAARELDLLRLGSNLRPTLDAPSRLRFANLVPSGDILSVNGKLTLHRALAFPFALENKHFVAFLFTEALLGMEPGEERIQMLLSLVPHLRRMLTQPQARMQLTLGAFRGKRSLNARVMTLMRKMMDLYLSQRADADEMPVDIHYFRSVLTYYFRTVYKPFGIQIAIADSVEDCPFLFYEHRDLAAMLLFTLQLLLDRSGAARVYIDVTTEGEQVMVKYSAILHGDWTMPDDSLPDAYILFSLLRRYGIDFAFCNEIEEDSARMVCRMYLPVRVATPILGVHSHAKPDYERAVLDFLWYLEALTCAQ